uniref:Glycosyltransferase 2-like domain-containing protein n=1 Tax=viral metagenome TaxID=1070528 RepID=A0A6C0KQD3_9ZZZZ
MPSKFVKLNILILVLSLLWIVLAYFGYVRYVKLRTGSLDHYAQEYLKTPRANTKNKIIVSMTTTTGNLENIKASVNSILDQTVHSDQIIISIPEDKDIVLPDYIKNNHIVLVHKLSKDYGKSASIFSPLLREKDGEALIILVDDAGIYGSDFIETLVDTSNQNPNSVIFVSGYNGKELAVNKTKVNNPESNDIISVPDGVLIKPKFFNDDIFNLEDSPQDIINTPDVLLSSYLKKHNINSVQIRYDENFRKFKYVLPNSERNISYFASLFPSFK